jgi:hypothetical protein
MRLSENVMSFFKRAVPVVLLLIIVTLCSCSQSHNSGAPPPGVSLAPSLIFSTYLGGTTPCASCSNALTFAQNTASDANGNTYVTGATTVSDMPVKYAYQSQPAAGSTMSAFVAKYDPTGKLLWCTYLGGDNQSVGVGVAVMPNGGVAVAGLTSSDSSGPFPTMNPFQAVNNGQSDYFVTVFDKDGNLQYSTYLGGSGVEGTPGSVFTDNNSNGNNIAVDAQGLVYVTGTTASGGSETTKFPVTPNAVQSGLGGSTNAFLSVIDPSKKGVASLLYSSFLGGSKDDKGHGVAVNASGSSITVVGYTNSRNFPATSNAYRNVPPPSGFTSNGFVTQFKSSLPGNPSSQYSMSYSTYLGGGDTNDARDDTYAVAMDPTGLIVVTGRTQSADFPMLDSSDPSIFNSAPYLKPGTSNDEPYLVKINPALNGKASLVYATFLGGGSATPGGGGAFCTSVAVDSNGMSYVGGETSSQGVLYEASSTPSQAPSLFPYTQDALLPALQGSFDAMLMEISPEGSTLSYSTFLGGTDNDRTYGIAVDPFGNVVLTGLTLSSDFPVKNPAQTWPGNKGNQNAFITKFGR